MQSEVTIVNVDCSLLFSGKKCSSLSPSSFVSELLTGKILACLRLQDRFLFSSHYCGSFTFWVLPVSLTYEHFVRWCRHLHLCCTRVMLSKECRDLLILVANRQHLSNRNCSEDNREDYYNCTVLYCVPQLCTVMRTHMNSSYRWVD